MLSELCVEPLALVELELPVEPDPSLGFVVLAPWVAVALGDPELRVVVDVLTPWVVVL